MAISTLSEYYSSKGQALPSVAERQGIAAQAGIQNYTGTAQQNTQLLSSLIGNQGNQTPTPTPTIPGTVATGTTTPMDLPNRPTPQEPSNVYSNASAYISSLPKTGVAGLDQTLQAMAERPGQLAQQYDIANKQSLMNEAKNKLDAFNEQYRVQQERIRTEGGKTLEQINSEVNAIERTRAFTAGTLAIEAAYRTGDYQGARELMNQQAQLELEPLKMKYDFFKDLYNRTEDQKFQRAMRAEERAYQAAKESANRINDLKMQAIKDGVPYDQVKGIRSIEDYAKLTGQKTVDILSAEQAKDKVLSIDNIINNKTGKNFGVGSNIFTRGKVSKVASLGIIGLATGGAQKDFVANTEAVLSGLTLDALKNAKAQGATFGALSEAELILLQNSASVIQQAKLTDKKGKVIGYNIPQSTFDREMEKIKKYAIIDYERRTGKPYTTENDPLGLGIDITVNDPAGLFK